MANNALLEKLLAGNTVLGFANMYPASGIIEGAAKDFDFAWIDSQHGEHDYRTVLAACQACSGVDVAALVRVPGQEPALLGMYADLAPLGMMIPMVNTAEEAQCVVDALYFPPRGSRSFGGRRIIDLYGRDMPTEFHMIVIAQIETLKAVENTDAIINTDGIDMLFFGPDDMRICMGLPMNTPVLENDQLRDAAQRMWWRRGGSNHTMRRARPASSPAPSRSTRSTRSFSSKPAIRQSSFPGTSPVCAQWRPNHSRM